MKNEEVYEQYLARIWLECDKLIDSGVFYNTYFCDNPHIDEMATKFCDTIPAMEIEEYYSNDSTLIRESQPEFNGYATQKMLCDANLIYLDVRNYMSYKWMSLERDWKKSKL